MRALRLDRRHKLRVTEVGVPKPHSGQVLIEVHNASILNIDTLYSHQDSPLGYEASGLVVQSGGGRLADSLLHRRIARLVQVSTQGAWAEYMVAPAEDCVVLSDNVSYTDGATMTNAMTLGIAMHLIRPRNSVVLSVPLSGLGRLASAWFRLLGIHCIRVVHKAEYVEKLRAETNEPVLLSSSSDFSQQLRSLCRQHNATAAFEMAGGQVGTAIYSALQPNSVFVQIGNMESWGSPYGSDAGKRVESFLLLSWLRSHSSEAKAILREVLNVLPALTASDPVRIFPVSDCEDALLTFLSNRSKCRVQIQFHS
jgi:NADPH:quinone reductase-like Zn-dependent oxidoreductase